MARQAYDGMLPRGSKVWILRTDEEEIYDSVQFLITVYIQPFYILSSPLLHTANRCEKGAINPVEPDHRCHECHWRSYRRALVYPHLQVSNLGQLETRWLTYNCTYLVELRLTPLLQLQSVYLHALQLEDTAVDNSGANKTKIVEGDHVKHKVTVEVLV